MVNAIIGASAAILLAIVFMASVRPENAIWPLLLYSMLTTAILATIAAGIIRQVGLDRE